MHAHHGLRRAIVLAIAFCAALASVMAGTPAKAQSPSPSQGVTETQPAPRLAVADVVRIGFFANLTHAPALVGQQLRLFETAVGKDGTKVEYVLFNAGPAAIEAMKGGAIDLAYIGPSPAVTGFATTGGKLLKVISGVTSGGAQFVVRSGLTNAQSLRGKKIATPQLGNTQDVALRSWLKSQGLSTTTSGGGDVPVFPTANATTLSLFRRGDIDGAWLPEPWSSRLVVEAGAKVLVDEKSLWPNGQFVTTNLIAESGFLQKFPGTVRSVLQANNGAIAYINSNPARAKQLANQSLRQWTGKPLIPSVLDRSWGNLKFTWDALPATLKKGADDAHSVGLLPSANINGIYDLRLLNGLLASSGKPAVSAGGLGAA